MKTPDFDYIQHKGLEYAPFIPLRITEKEWEDIVTPYTEDGILVAHPKFSMQSYKCWTGNIESGGWDYCDVIEIALRFGPQRYRTFGPHKTNGLAQRKARDFLLKHHAIEIIGERKP